MINTSKRLITVIGRQNLAIHSHGYMNSFSSSTSLFQHTGTRAKSTISSILPTAPEAHHYADLHIFSNQKSKPSFRWVPTTFEPAKENILESSTSTVQCISERDNSPIVTIEDAFSRFKKEEVGVGDLSFDDVLQCAVTNDFDDSGLGRLLKAQGHFQNGSDFYGHALYELEKAVELDSRVKNIALEYIKNINKNNFAEKFKAKNNNINSV